MVSAMDRAREDAPTATGDGILAGHVEPGGITSSKDGLSCLMEVEARLEVRLAEARADAARAIASAEDKGRRADAEFDADFALLLRESEERAASECESALAKIRAQSAAAAARFDSIDGSFVDELADMVIDRLLEGREPDRAGPA